MGSVASHSVSFAVYGRESVERGGGGGGGGTCTMFTRGTTYMYLLALEGILKSRASLCA